MCHSIRQADHYCAISFSLLNKPVPTLFTGLRRKLTLLWLGKEVFSVFFKRGYYESCVWSQDPGKKGVPLWSGIYFA